MPICSLYWKSYCCVRAKYYTRQKKCPFVQRRRRVKDRQARADDLLISYYLQQGRCSQCLLSLSYETSHKNRTISLRPVFCDQRGTALWFNDIYIRQPLRLRRRRDTSRTGSWLLKRYIIFRTVFSLTFNTNTNVSLVLIRKRITYIK